MSKVFVAAGLVLLLLLSVATPWLWSSALQSHTVQGRDNIVVILVDTLRADKLPFYGYSKNTAPFLNRIAKRSAVFDSAFSASSTTAPAVASVFTSLYPSQHGVKLGKKITYALMKKHSNISLNRIPADITTMAQYFKSQGYRTYGLADNFNISPELGFSAGFDKFRYFHNEGAARLNSQLRAWSSGMKQGQRPYFLYLHYMDPHSPYEPRAPWFKPSEHALTNQINAYESEISYVDSKISEVFRMLSLESNALVVVLADHGEEFGEHGDFGHGRSLYREVVHVPFFFYHRSLPAKRITPMVSTLDLLPTIAGLAGLEPLSQWQGADLSQLMLGQKTFSQRTLLMELLHGPEHPRLPQRAIATQGLHLIATYNRSDSTSYELYDLKQDFGEEANIIEHDSTRSNNLKDELHALEDLDPYGAPEQVQLELDKQTLDQMQSLGYVD